MNNLVRSIMMVSLVALAFAGGVLVTLRAAEPAAGAQAAPPAGRASQQATPAASAKSTPSAKSAPNAKPATPGQSAAPIEDEPTVAPDSQESADNSVTFPADI